MAGREKGSGREVAISRREVIAASASVCFAMRSSLAAAASSSSNVIAARYSIESESEDRRTIAAVHGGKQSIDLRRYRFSNAPRPANFITYTLPPGASEGVHVHFDDDRNGEGAFDEYYFILSGSGQMEIEGEIVPVREGDHIHTPLTVPHGIENTHPTAPLKVFLTFVDRRIASAGSKPLPR